MTRPLPAEKIQPFVKAEVEEEEEDDDDEEEDDGEKDEEEIALACVEERIAADDDNDLSRDPEASKAVSDVAQGVCEQRSLCPEPQVQQGNNDSGSVADEQSKFGRHTSGELHATTTKESIHATMVDFKQDASKHKEIQVKLVEKSDSNEQDLHAKIVCTHEASSEQPSGQSVAFDEDSVAAQSSSPTHKCEETRPAFSPQAVSSPSEKSVRRPVQAPASKPAMNPLGMVEEEADDEDAHLEQEESPTAEQFTDSEDENNGDDGIVHDTPTQNPSDAAQLAKFHRDWEMNKEQADIQAAAGVPFNDMDEAMDLTDLLRKEEADVGDADNASLSGAQNDDAEGGDRGSEVGNVDHAEEYVEAMFRRDDSKSRLMDIEEDEGDGEQAIVEREKARALWKARQKFKMKLEREDENSLSRFDLFNDSAKNRGAKIRRKLERTCRSAPVGDDGKDAKIGSAGVKRSASSANDSGAPEWARRKACLELKERKRQRSVSVGRWSFASHGAKERSGSAPIKGTGYSGALPQTASHAAHKPRSRLGGVVMPQRVRPMRPVRPEGNRVRSGNGPTSFKGLLSILGQQAETTRQ